MHKMQLGIVRHMHNNILIRLLFKSVLHNSKPCIHYNKQFSILTWSWVGLNVPRTQEEIGCHGDQERQAQQSRDHPLAGVAMSGTVATVTGCDQESFLE